jgi:two-component system, chemotaxis family, chemotaxis protein CheV
MANSILLEAGTNEMELLVFKLGTTPFGINVAKVREVVQRQKTIHIPHAPGAVDGSFLLRDRVLTLVSLGRHFNMEGEETRGGNGLIIVVEFNEITCGVLVDHVERIYRLRWDEIEAPSKYLVDMRVPVTGVAKVGKQIVLIADFETLVSEILGVQSAGKVAMDELDLTADRKTARIILADDSSILRNNLVQILSQAGFDNLTVCTDGQEVWDLIEKCRHDPEGPCDLVLTDIEMPRMDGLHLPRRIKDDPSLCKIPVVLFSSLITEDNLRKGQSVGADAQVSKPDSKGMIEAIDRCLESRTEAVAVG